VTRESLQQFQFSSLAENWGVHAKLINKYQILYLDRITIVPWHHLVNGLDLCRSPKSPKIHKNPLFWHSRSFKDIKFGTNWEPVYDFLLVKIIVHRLYLAPLLRYSDLKLAPNRKFCPPPLILRPRLPSSRWWRFGDPSLHRFWLIHPCDRQTGRQTNGQNCDG